MQGRLRAGALAAFVAVVVVGVSSEAPAEPERAGPEGAALKPLATGLNIPWGLDFLPSGNALVTERSSGDIFRIRKDGGPPKRVMTVPGVDPNAGEGGLLGLALSPDYKQDKLVYAYLTTNSDNRIVRFRLGEELQPILTGIDRATTHNGGRIEFGPDGMLYAGVGDAQNLGDPQDKDALNGKILRIRPNGSVPKDNPFRGSPVWSLGHRNVQGLAWDRDGRLWATEFGQNNFDEVNLIKPGRNYGWPKVEGRGGTRNGKFNNPKVIWRPEESSPSGAAIRGRKLYVAALRGERLWEIPLRGNEAKKPKPTLVGRYGRLRTVEVAPNDSLWIATSNGGGSDRIIKLAR